MFMLASCVFMQSYLMKGKNKTGILDPLNELHLFCLHYTYLPRINKSLEEFVDQMKKASVNRAYVPSPAMDEWYTMGRRCGQY